MHFKVTLNVAYDLDKHRIQLSVVYSKNPHKRTVVLGVQADFVLIHRVFSAKSA